MLWRLIKHTTIFIGIILLFTLLLLLPRDLAVEHTSGIQFDAHYPFTFELYKDNVTAFAKHFYAEKGFGKTPAGTPLTEHVQRYVKRSLKIILPTLLVTMIIGTISGIFLFLLRHRIIGRLTSFLSAAFASIPDFFLFICIQYLLILAMHHGLPKFELFTSDHWYSFIVPMISLTIFPFFHIVRMTMTAMENEANKNYVRTAQAKGMERIRVIGHIFWNVLPTIINQSQMIMLYILSSLPIIEKLANYHGAGYQLLDSILDHENVYALLYFLPLLLLMYITVIVTQFVQGRFDMKGGGSL